MALLPVPDALARVLEGAEPLPAERVPLAEAEGRVLAEDLAARRTQPPDDVSAMDGYAVRGEDVAERARAPEAHRRGRGRPAVRRHGRQRRSRAHLHRRRAAAGHRHRRDPGEHRARRRHGRRRRRRRRAARTSASPASISARRRAPETRPPPHRRAMFRSPPPMNHATLTVIAARRSRVVATGDELVAARHRARPRPDRPLERLRAGRALRGAKAPR